MPLLTLGLIQTLREKIFGKYAGIDKSDYILYVNKSGFVFGDSNATRDSSTQETVIAAEDTATGDTGEFVVSNSDAGIHFYNTLGDIDTGIACVATKTELYYAKPVMGTNAIIGVDENSPYIADGNGIQYRLPASDSAGAMVSDGAGQVSFINGIDQVVVIPAVGTLTFTKGILTSFV